MAVAGAGRGKNEPTWTEAELRDEGCQYHQPTCSTCSWEKCYLDVWDALPKGINKTAEIIKIYGAAPIFTGR